MATRSSEKPLELHVGRLEGDALTTCPSAGAAPASPPGAPLLGSSQAEKGQLAS